MKASESLQNDESTATEDALRRAVDTAIPTEITGAEKTLHLNGATVALKYYGPAHTDGDISAYFIEADVLYTGDTWWNGHFPSSIIRLAEALTA